MQHVVDKYIAFRAKVVFAVLASIPIKWTHPLAHVCGGCVLERPCAGVAARARHSVQCHPAPTFQSNTTNKRVHCSHDRVRLDGEQVVVAPREMRRRDDHEPTHVAVGRRVAEPRTTARAQKPRGAHLRVAHAQRRGRGVRQALREAHHHQVRAHLAARGARVLLLRGRGDEFEEEVLEVALVHRDAKGTWVRYI